LAGPVGFTGSIGLMSGFDGTRGSAGTSAGPAFGGDGNSGFGSALIGGFGTLGTGAGNDPPGMIAAGGTIGISAFSGLSAGFTSPHAAWQQAGIAAA
jgi:hypothetical protein